MVEGFRLRKRMAEKINTVVSLLSSLAEDARALAEVPEVHPDYAEQTELPDPEMFTWVAEELSAPVAYPPAVEEAYLRKRSETEVEWPPADHRAEAAQKLQQLRDQLAFAETSADRIAEDGDGPELDWLRQRARDLTKRIEYIEALLR